MEEVKQGNLDLVDELVNSHGIDPNQSDPSGMTPLHFAARRGYEEIVGILLEAKADPGSANATGMTPLHHAAAGGHKEIIEFLCDEAKANLFVRDNNGMSIVHHAAYQNWMDVITFAFRRRMNIDAADKNGWTPLMYGAQQGNLSVCILLLDLGAITTQRNKYDKTALDIAEINERNDVKRLFTKVRASVVNVPLESIQQAARTGMPSIAEDTEGRQLKRRATRTVLTMTHGIRAAAVLDMYDLLEKIGGGSIATCHRAKRKDTGQVVCLKTIPKVRVEDINALHRQMQVHERANHPHIARLYESFADDDNHYYAMELCDGGDLSERTAGDAGFTESKAAAVMVQVLKAIAYLHNLGVVHRNIKLQNFLYSSKAETALVKLVDFGQAFLLAEHTVQPHRGGNFEYMAPEAFGSHVDFKCDIWSCGVLLYTLLVGKTPFDDPKMSNVIANVRRARWTFDDPAWEQISPQAKAFISVCLSVDPQDRPNAEQALNHAWFTEYQAHHLPTRTISSNMVQNMRKYHAADKLKKASLMVMANSASDEITQELRELFLQLDTTGKGILAVSSVLAAIRQEGYEIPPELLQVLEDMDSGGQGTIDYKEFIAATVDQASLQTEQALLTAFRAFDPKNTGHIRASELVEMLERDGFDNVQEMLQDISVSEGGVMNFEQFKDMMNGCESL
eukprot:CAMPEP_0204337142 /NCGR_PEP_ID=MMETSP0469-20131031/20080_1 /ASSEMBLY_ACC=CAM_ASM_000384 /TAXON_ID=2969 /ORGANISM="Oxyrrhis marina" /LENGTH=678 /DNA_ID=CAMNT_0051321119 /DNA_START=1 /DNA_END=2033 /DNA_ORIENTATION=-